MSEYESIAGNSDHGLDNITMQNLNFADYLTEFTMFYGDIDDEFYGVMFEAIKKSIQRAEQS